LKPRFFKSAAAFRGWLEKHHASSREVWLGFYKAGSDKRGISYKESVDVALCFGWIDGIRRSLDDERYVQRFTPRTAKSYWSAVNTKRAHELIAEGRMHAAGQAAFDRRDAGATARYSFERETAELSPADLARFEKHARARPRGTAASPSTGSSARSARRRDSGASPPSSRIRPKAGG
jgi:uncharacterized protein YdeI (YjbR/CyaY-like superfamily)